VDHRPALCTDCEKDYPPARCHEKDAADALERERDEVVRKHDALCDRLRALETTLRDIVDLAKPYSATPSAYGNGLRDGREQAASIARKLVG
jgi:uncharacterized CHY-type Zn-finger protein